MTTPDESSEIDAIRDELGLRIDWDDSDISDPLEDPEIRAILSDGLSIHERTENFEKTLAAVAAAMTELPTQINQIECTGEDEFMQVTVGPNGILKDIVFHPEAIGADSMRLSKSFSICYAAATQVATEELLALMQGLHNLNPDVGGLTSLFEPTLQRANQVLDELDS